MSDDLMVEGGEGKKLLDFTKHSHHQNITMCHHMFHEGICQEYLQEHSLHHKAEG